MSEHDKKTGHDIPEQDIGEDINVTTILSVGVITMLIVAVVIVALIGLFHQSEQREIEQKAALAPEDALAQLRRDQLASLGSYEWVDHNNGVISIPVDRAIELVIAELSAPEPAGEPEPAAEEPVIEEVAHEEE